MEIELKTDQYSATVPATVKHVTQSGSLWKYSMQINDEIDDADKQSDLQIVFDRQHTLPIVILSGWAEDLRGNLRASKASRQASNRRLPRVVLARDVDTADGKRVQLSNFNYEFIRIDSPEAPADKLVLNWKTAWRSPARCRMRTTAFIRSTTGKRPPRIPACTHSSRSGWARLSRFLSGRRAKRKDVSPMRWPVALLSALLLISLIFTVLARHESAELKQNIEQLNAELDTCYETIKVLEDPGNGVAGHGALHVESTQLTDEHGEPVQLRGMSTHGLTWYPQYTNANAMKTIAEYGGNVVRLAVYADHYDDAGASDALYMALENALATDLYVIVDWHVLDDGDPNLSADSAEEFFTQIAGGMRTGPPFSTRSATSRTGTPTGRMWCSMRSASSR